MLDSKVYSFFSEETFENIFRSSTSTSIPLLKERFQILRQAGLVLLDKFEGKFVHVLKLADHSALKLLSILCHYFPSFYDKAVYKDQPSNL